MDRTEKKTPKKEDITPIIDGDARPDINLEPKAENTNPPIPIPHDQEKKKDQPKEKFTTNRVDTNSLEDFRDSK